jgi:hypothetical protein
MPQLRITNGIPITPKDTFSPTPAPPGPEELQPTDATAPTPAADLGTTTKPQLPIDVVAQEGNQWCWAACVEMVLTLYGRPQEQCVIVGRQLAAPDNSKSCSDIKNQFDEKTCEAEEIINVWKQSDVTVAAQRGTIDDPKSIDKIEDIKAQIKKNSPVEAGILWFEQIGGGHAVLIVGYDETGTQPVVWVNEPEPQSKRHLNVMSPNGGQQGKITLDELAHASHRGLWVHSWTDFSDNKAPHQ